MSRSSKTSSTEPSAAELRAATAWSLKYEQYLHGSNIFWVQRSDSEDFCFSWYASEFPAELARMLSEQCHLQLPRRPIVTAGDSPMIKRPAVDLSRSGGPPLILKQHLWHLADALEHLFDWILRFSYGDRAFQAAPPSVYSRFHPVELVNYLKLQHAGLFVGAHEFFMTAITAKIADFTAPSGARAHAKAIKTTIKDLDREQRQDLIETIALAVMHKRLATISQVFKVDVTLCDDIAQAVADSQQSQHSRKAQSRKSNSAAEGTSSDSEGLDAQEVRSPGWVLVESSQTDLSASQEQTDTDAESLASSVEDSMLG